MSRHLPSSSFDLAIFWRRKWSILIATIFTVALGVIYLLLTEKVHEVQTRILVQKNATGIDRDQNHRWDREFVATQAELIRSPLILRAALDQAPLTIPDPQTDPVKYVLDRLIVAPVVQTDVLSIQFRTADPDECVKFVNSIVKAYEEHLQEIDTDTNSESVELLTHRERELRERLHQLDEEHIQLRKNSPLIGQSKDIVNVHAAMLSQLAQKLTASRLRKVELDSQLQSLAMTDQRRLSSIDDGSTIKTIAMLPSSANVARTNLEYGPQLRNLVIANLMRDDHDLGARNIVEMEQQLQLAEVKRQQALQKFGARHAEAKLAEAEVAEWEEMLDARLAAAVDSVQQQLQVETVAETSLSKLYEDEQAEVKAIDDFLLKDEKTRAEIARTEEIYNTVLARLSEVELSEQAVASGHRSIVVRDLEGPELKAEVSWPQPKKFLALCGIVGLIGGVLLSLAVESVRGGSADESSSDES